MWMRGIQQTIPTVSPALTYILLGVAALSVFDSFVLRLGSEKEGSGGEPEPSQPGGAGGSTPTAGGTKDSIEGKEPEDGPQVDDPQANGPGVGPEA